ncbi:hypothetical protein ACFX2J_009208 [Malus domestica]
MSGNQVRVWVDRWVPDLEGRRPTPAPGVVADPNFLVTSLINSHTKSWLEDEVEGRVEMQYLMFLLETPSKMTV